MTAWLAVLALPAAARAQSAAVGGSGFAFGESFRVEAVAAVWDPSADIVVASDGRGIAGTPIDFESDLGLTARRRFPAIQIAVRPAPKHKVRFEYIPIEYEATATLGRDIVFNGIVYERGRSTTGTLDWTAYRFGYEYDFLVRRRGFAGVIGELRQTDITGRLVSVGANESHRKRMPVPAAGGIVRVYPAANFSIAGEATFMKVPDRADKKYGGSYVDADVYGTLDLTHNIGARVGFRTLKIHHFGSEDLGNITVSGVYLGAVVRY